jgi:hypothetical protein
VGSIAAALPGSRLCVLPYHKCTGHNNCQRSLGSPCNLRKHELSTLPSIVSLSEGSYRDKFQNNSNGTGGQPYSLCQSMAASLFGFRHFTRRVTPTFPAAKSHRFLTGLIIVCSEVTITSRTWLSYRGGHAVSHQLQYSLGLLEPIYIQCTLWVEVILTLTAPNQS